jgi:hypothetical protein
LALVRSGKASNFPSNFHLNAWVLPSGRYSEC